MIRVSFDFDGSLGASYKMRIFAKELVESGYDVWIVTSRWEDVKNYGWTVFDHSDIDKVAKWCGITKDHIKFCNMLPKADFFFDSVINGHPFLWHIDDDKSELSLINEETPTKGISCSDGTNWPKVCKNLIKERNEKHKEN